MEKMDTKDDAAAQREGVGMENPLWHPPYSYLVQMTHISLRVGKLVVPRLNLPLKHLGTTVRSSTTVAPQESYFLISNCH